MDTTVPKQAKQSDQAEHFSGWFESQPFRSQSSTGCCCVLSAVQSQAWHKEGWVLSSKMQPTDRRESEIPPGRRRPSSRNKEEKRLKTSITWVHSRWQVCILSPSKSLDVPEQPARRHIMSAVQLCFRHHQTEQWAYACIRRRKAWRMAGQHREKSKVGLNLEPHHMSNWMALQNTHIPN